MKTAILIISSILLLVGQVGCYRYSDTGVGNVSCCPPKFQKYVNVYKWNFETMQFEHIDIVLKPLGWGE